jgi:hypothetical protein
MDRKPSTVDSSNNLFEQIITQHIHLDPPSAKGWYPVLCKVCNDHGKKGKRAAFVFTEHGGTYNCFNCGHVAVYEPTENKNPSKNMVEVFESFGILKVDWGKLTLDALTGEYSKAVSVYQSIEPDEIPLLPFFYPLVDDPDDDWCQYSIEYLANRGIDWKTYPFHCVKHQQHVLNARWYGRLIIPIYKDNKLIFYQGRDLTDLHQKKYLSASVARDNVMYGYDQIQGYNTDPLYVVEGWFDASALSGVAIFGNKLTKSQITWLNKSRRPKVVIPDRYGSGHILAEQAIDLGWSISTLDKSDDCKDVNDSIRKHGLLYTLRTIMQNTVSGNLAKVVINLYCEKGT